MLTLTPASLVMLWYNFYSGDEKAAEFMSK